MKAQQVTTSTCLRSYLESFPLAMSQRLGNRVDAVELYGLSPGSKWWKAS